MEPIGGNPRRRRPARAQCWSSPQVSGPPSQCACAKWVAPPCARARQCACGRFRKPSLAHGTAAGSRGLQKMLCRILMTMLLAPSKRVLWRTAVSRSRPPLPRLADNPGRPQGGGGRQGFLGSRARTGPCRVRHNLFEGSQVPFLLVCVLARTRLCVSFGSQYPMSRAPPRAASRAVRAAPRSSGGESGFSATKDEPSPAAKSLFEKPNSSAGAPL